MIRMCSFGDCMNDDDALGTLFDILLPRVSLTGVLCLLFACPGWGTDCTDVRLASSIIADLDYTVEGFNFRLFFEISTRIKRKMIVIGKK